MNSNKKLRIIFMGTPDFAVGVLKRLLEADYPIVGVVTAPDRPAGRGRSLKASAVKQYALANQLPLLQPTNLKDSSFVDQLKELEVNLQIVVAFRMLPKVVWQLPEYGTFNLHASLLPHYRGAAPIHWAIINGDRKTGVTTFFIDEKIDTGAIIDAREVAIGSRETVGSLHDTLMEVGAELVVETVDKVADGTVTTMQQPMEDAYHKAPKLTPDNTRIDWNWKLEVIDSFVRGLDPFPTAWTQLKNADDLLKMKIYKATPIYESHDHEIGSIHTSKDDLKIAVANGYLKLDELQLPGKRKMDAKSLLNGFEFDLEAKVV